MNEQFRPVVEALEDRLVLDGGLITGPPIPVLALQSDPPPEQVTEVRPVGRNGAPGVAEAGAVARNLVETPIVPSPEFLLSGNPEFVELLV